MNKKYIKYNKMIVNIEYDKLMYSLEETQMNIIITLLPIIVILAVASFQILDNLLLPLKYILPLMFRSLRNNTFPDTSN